MTRSSIRSEFLNAVLRIQCKTAENPRWTGTGYLVENTRGYLVTAAHVVSPCVGPITVFSGDQPSRSFLVDRVIPDSAADIAILKLKPEGAVANIRPLDVSARFLQDDKHYTAGFPVEGGQPALTVEYQEVQVKRVVHKQELAAGTKCEPCILVGGDVFRGDSGSPLISPRGFAVGIGLDLQVQTGIFTPTRNATGLLSGLPETRRLADLQKRMRDGTIDEYLLFDALRPSSWGLTNVELLIWVTDILAHPDSYSGVKKYLNCPLAVALRDRGLAEAAVRLAPLLSSSVRGSTLLIAGEDLIALGDLKGARVRLEAANSELQSAYLQAESTGLRGQEKLYVLMDRARALIKLFDVGGAYRDRMLDAMAMSGQAALGLEAERAKAVAISLLGDAALRAERPVISAKAFATSKAQGLEASWVTVNWEVATRKAVRRGGLPAATLRRGITQAPTLSEQAIRFIAQVSWQQ
jgi:hypothetical protein